MKKKEIIFKVIGGEDEIRNLRAEICKTMALITEGEKLGLDCSSFPKDTTSRLAAVSTAICLDYINNKVDGLEHLSDSRRKEFKTEFIKYVLSDILEAIGYTKK